MDNDNKNIIETIELVEYFKVIRNDNDNPIFIMTINKEKAYKMGLDGKWVHQPGLYDYLFNNVDDNDLLIESIDVSIALKESRQKKLKLSKK